MGVKIYRDNNWYRIKCGEISRRDTLGLDSEKDRYLINYLILNSSDAIRNQIMRRKSIEELPEETVNIDDPDDETYRTYFVLREQVQREPDLDVLRNAAFSGFRDDLSRFAFCRLTGFSWPSSECDAYSYRTYFCGLKSDVMREDIEEICFDMIEADGPFAEEAKGWLTELSAISDEELDEWASEDTEEEEALRPHEVLKKLMAPGYGKIEKAEMGNIHDGEAGSRYGSATGSMELSKEELAAKIRGAADAYILMVYEEKNGMLPRLTRKDVTDPFIREVAKVLKQLNRDMVKDPVEAAVAVLLTGRAMPKGMTRKEIAEIVWSESDGSPMHSWFLDIAHQHGIS